MRKISSKKLLLSLIVSAMLSPALATNSLEGYIDETLDRYQTVSEAKIAANKSAELSIEKLLTSSQPTRHQELKSNLNAIEEGAKAHNPDDLFLLGYYYYSEGENDNNPQTFAKAREYFLDAEKMGSKDASFLLGELYYYGEGVKQDYQKAAEYYQKAADQGQAEALFSLASLYMSGRGVPEDQNKAIELYEAAANRNHTDSINVLAYAYENGNIGDIQADRETALSWYQKGCEQGNAASCESQDQLTVRSESFEDLLTQIKQENSQANIAVDIQPLASIAEIRTLNPADRLSLLNDYIPALIEGTEMENADDTYLLALLYETKGELNNSEADYQKAKTLLEKAAQWGSKEANYNLGELYYYGNGVDQDYQKAFEYYSTPILSDYPDALFSLAVQYDLGEGVDQSYDKSLELYKKAAALGHAPSTFNVGYMYEHGEAVEQDLREALRWYQQACDMQYQDGCYAYSIVKAYFPADSEEESATLANDEINMTPDSEASLLLVADANTMGSQLTETKEADETQVLDQIQELNEAQDINEAEYIDETEGTEIDEQTEEMNSASAESIEQDTVDSAESDEAVAEILAIESTELETEDPELVLLEAEEAAEEVAQGNSLIEIETIEEASADAEPVALQNLFDEIIETVTPKSALTLNSASILAADPEEAKAFLLQEMPQILQNIKVEKDSESLFLAGYLFLLEAYDHEDLETLAQAVKLLEIASESGDINATFYLGKIYFDTAESDSDMIKARYYFEKLRDKDHPEALFYLASLYDLGLGIPQNQTQSFALYKTAAQLGYAPAAYNVGYMYEYGEAVDVNLEKAGQWYSEACLLGDQDGCTKVQEITARIEAENQKIAEMEQKVEGGIKNLFKEIINNIQAEEEE